MTAQEILESRYGSPQAGNFESKWMTLWEVKKEFTWFPKKTIYIHKDFCELLKGAFKDLERLNLHTEIKFFDGCFNIRLVRGSKTVYSIHSWGCAMDLNAAENPLASEGVWSREFINVMVNHGIFCGQNWIGRKDPMHFALVNG
ncbi:MAG: hypothetical protein JWO44_231 [Bacteroidetes bacterium]|nr:hypothetical protein [Bacteroidota bacterium]